MQEDHYFRHILHAEEITGRPAGGGHRSMSTPLNTPLPFANCHIFSDSSLPWSMKYFMHGSTALVKLL